MTEKAFGPFVPITDGIFWKRILRTGVMQMIDRGSDFRRRGVKRKGGTGQGEELSKDMISTGNQLEPVWICWKLWSMNSPS